VQKGHLGEIGERAIINLHLTKMICTIRDHGDMVLDDLTQTPSQVEVEYNHCAGGVGATKCNEFGQHLLAIEWEGKKNFLFFASPP